MTEKNENILIGYTKWLLKWVAILCLLGGVGIGGWLGYEEYQRQEVFVAAIKCDSYQSDSWSNENPYFLITRSRKKDLPGYLYSPAYNKNTITKALEPDDYEWVGFFKKEDRGLYMFPSSYPNDFPVYLVRRTDFLVVYAEKDEKTAHKLKNCQQITEQEFLAESERGLREKQSKFKF